MNQTELAESLGVHQNQVSRYERNLMNPSFETLLQMTQLFNTTTDYLLGVSAVPHPGAEPDPHPDLSPAEAAMIELMRTRDEKAKARLVEAVRLLWETDGSEQD